MESAGVIPLPEEHAAKGTVPQIYKVKQDSDLALSVR